MAQVTITVNGRDHRIGCDDGEEDRVRELAAIVDERATALAKQIGPSSDSRLLLMTAILMADDIASARTGKGNAVAETPAKPSQEDTARIAELANRLEDIAERVETA